MEIPGLNRALLVTADEVAFKTLCRGVGAYAVVWSCPHSVSALDCELLPVLRQGEKVEGRDTLSDER